MSLKRIYIFILIGLLLSACKFGGDSKPLERSDSTAVHITRYDKLLTEYVKFNSFSALQKMNTESMQETKILIEDVLSIGRVNDDNIHQKLKEFYSDTTLLQLMADVEAKYEDIGKIEKQINKGFARLTKEVPQLPVPHVYTQISAFNESIIVQDSLIGISLDKYMGADYPLYKKFYYDYQCRSMSPERIVPDCFFFYLFSKYPLPANSKRTLLHTLLHFGKLNYIVQEILNISSAEDLLGYSKREKAWCESHRKTVWEYMLANGHLHATDPQIIRNYTKPAPDPVYFGDDSPPLIGIWVGMQIISSYIEHNKKVTIQQLLNTTDYDLVLAKSQYTSDKFKF